MGVDMARGCVGMRTGMCVDMCMDMCIDMCTDIVFLVLDRPRTCSRAVSCQLCTDMRVYMHVAMRRDILSTEIAIGMHIAVSA